MNGRHSELSPVESQLVHELAVAANLHPIKIEVDLQANLVFHAGEHAFDTLADWCLHATDLAALRRAGDAL